MNQLDESWNKKSREDFPYNQLSYKPDSDIYLDGASDFQNKAIEELSKDISMNLPKGYMELINKYYLKKVIQIIKELKIS